MIFADLNRADTQHEFLINELARDRPFIDGCFRDRVRPEVYDLAIFRLNTELLANRSKSFLVDSEIERVSEPCFAINSANCTKLAIAEASLN